jgi:hypothetical protein
MISMSVVYNYFNTVLHICSSHVRDLSLRILIKGFIALLNRKFSTIHCVLHDVPFAQARNHDIS